MGLELQQKKDDPKTLLLLWEGQLWKEVSKSLFFSELRKIPTHLTWEDFQTRFFQLELTAGRKYALYWLSRRALLSHELKAKLLSKGLSHEASASIIAYCQEKGFLDDDQEIARIVAKELRKGQSERAVFFKLKAKKVDESLLHKALQNTASSDAVVLQRWLEKNAHKIDRKDPHEMRKLMAKLCRKGFSFELVQKVLSKRDI